MIVLEGEMMEACFTLGDGLERPVDQLRRADSADAPMGDGRLR